MMITRGRWCELVVAVCYLSLSLYTIISRVVSLRHYLSQHSLSPVTAVVDLSASTDWE